MLQLSRRQCCNVACVRRAECGPLSSMSPFSQETRRPACRACSKNGKMSIGYGCVQKRYRSQRGFQVKNCTNTYARLFDLICSICVVLRNHSVLPDRTSRPVPARCPPGARPVPARCSFTFGFPLGFLLLSFSVPFAFLQRSLT